MDKKIGIIGLGRVGMPAAKAYIEAGYKVFGYDIKEDALNSFRDLQGQICTDPGDVLLHSDVVLVMVLNDVQVKEVIQGKYGILSRAVPGKTLICMSTINRFNLVSAAEICKQKNISFVDCPFTGGPARIPSGGLTLIAAAPRDLLDLVHPVLDVIGNIVHAGEEPGLGQAIKHCNQLLVGTTHAATMEVITLAKRLGLDPEIVCQVIGNGIAGSDYFRLLSESVLHNKPSPGGLGQMCKDVSIVVNTTQEVKMPAYVANATYRYFQIAETRHMQNREGADLIDVVESVSENE